MADPGVLCIEAGGSGTPELGNYDHHNTARPLSPSCRQALEQQGGGPTLQRLVDHVATMDTDPTGLPETPPPTLSGVFSGMLLSIRDPKERLNRGMEIFQTVLDRGWDPFGTMPEWLPWQGYIQAKQRNQQEVERANAEAVVCTSKGGLKVGYLKTDFIGALGVLYGMGCDVAVAYSPRFGDPPVPKYTVGGNGIRVDGLLSVLNSLEPGWGGPVHGTIIGSPRGGSKLSPDQVKRMVKECL